MRNCGSHIGQAFQADEPYGVEFGENWISVDPAVDYDKTLAAVQEVVDGYPGLRRDVQTYLKERIREVLTGLERCDRHPHLWSRTSGRCASMADEGRGQARRDPGHHRPAPEQLVDIPQIQVKVDLAAPSATA